MYCTTIRQFILNFLYGTRISKHEEFSLHSHNVFLFISVNYIILCTLRKVYELRTPSGYLFHSLHLIFRSASNIAQSRSLWFRLCTVFLLTSDVG